MIEIFNSREIAIGVWISILFIISLFKESLRQSYFDIITIFFSKKIIIPFALMIIYVIVWIYVLDRNNLWQENQIKNSVLWFASSASITFFRLNKIENPDKFFFAALKDNFKIIILVEFVISFYTFSLITEIILLPFLFTMIYLKANADINKENLEILPIINFVLLTILITGIGFTTYKLYTSSESFFQNSTFYDLIIPIRLSILIIPFHYFLHKYLEFAGIYFRLKHTLINKKLINYSFIKSSFSFRFNITKIKRWLFKLNMKELVTKKEIRDSISEINERILIEKNPPTVDKNLGWSPHSVISFLKSKSIKMGDYKECSNNEWFSCSDYIDLKSSAILKSNIAFYIEGNSDLVSEILVVINIRDFNSEKANIETYISTLKTLTVYATNLDLHIKLIKSIRNKKSAKIQLGIYDFETIKVSYPNNNIYELKFSIKITKPNTS